ncbi:MAG TPA: hypothetical protein VGR95_18470 [Thermoanaerobaculia bacterium]|jgi:hypothetical protein|nr:hypothetical protein [Thermoanaerobaculia bacterium]
MRGVSRRILRGAAALVLLSALTTSGAFAAPRDGGEDGWRARFHRFARFIVTIADELGMPPG